MLWVVTLGILVPAVVFATPKLLILGDSLSAAYGIPADAGWVSLLQRRLQTDGHAYEIVNSSISGETTSGALSRLPNVLKRHEPEVVVVELGANDGLRGFDLSRTREQLRAIIDLVESAGARVLLLGVKLPANYGSVYGEKFHQIYLDLAAQEHVALVPFFLSGFAEDRRLMQADGVHPTAEAQPLILDNVWRALVPLLD
jgi:acyl-CoA thioesterase-1